MGEGRGGGRLRAEKLSGGWPSSLITESAVPTSSLAQPGQSAAREDRGPRAAVLAALGKLSRPGPRLALFGPSWRPCHRSDAACCLAGRGLKVRVLASGREDLQVIACGRGDLASGHGEVQVLASGREDLQVLDSGR